MRPFDFSSAASPFANDKGDVGSDFGEMDGLAFEMSSLTGLVGLEDEDAWLVDVTVSSVRICA